MIWLKLLWGLIGMMLVWIVLGFCGTMLLMADVPAARINVGLWFVFLMVAVFVIVTLLRNVGRNKHNT